MRRSRLVKSRRNTKKPKKSIKRSVKKSVKKSVKRRKSVKRSVKRRPLRYNMGFESIPDSRKNMYPCRTSVEFAHAVRDYKTYCRLDSDMRSTRPYSRDEPIDRTIEEIRRYEDSEMCLKGRIETSLCFPNPFDERDRSEFMSYGPEDRKQIQGHFGSMNIIRRWMSEHKNSYDRRLDALAIYERRMAEEQRHRSLVERAKVMKAQKKEATKTPKKSNIFDLLDDN